MDKTDWTPEEALLFYAEQKNFDIVEGHARILDNGAIASNALKHLSIDRLELKGDAELAQLRSELAAAQAELANREGLVCGDCDGSGWLENRVDGKHPCTCMTEAEPYQLLQDKLLQVQADNARLRELWVEVEAKYFALLEEKDAEAEQFKAEGDMYGWNFHMGIRSGAVQMHLDMTKMIKALATNSPDYALKDYGAKLVEKELRDFGNLIGNGKAINYGAMRADKIRKGEF